MSIMGRAMQQTAVGGQAGGAEVRQATVVHPSARVWLSVADRDQYPSLVDASAGAEFLDDRLRLEE